MPPADRTGRPERRVARAEVRGAPAGRRRDEGRPRRHRCPAPPRQLPRLSRQAVALSRSGPAGCRARAGTAPPWTLRTSPWRSSASRSRRTVISDTPRRWQRWPQ